MRLILTQKHTGNIQDVETYRIWTPLYREINKKVKSWYWKWLTVVVFELSWKEHHLLHLPTAIRACESLCVSRFKSVFWDYYYNKRGQQWCHWFVKWSVPKGARATKGIFDVTTSSQLNRHWRDILAIYCGIYRPAHVREQCNLNVTGTNITTG